MTIQLQGLTKQQRQIADMIWACDSQQAVQNLKQSLPPEYRRDAETVYQLMIAAVMDQHQGIDDYAKAVINRCRYAG